MLATIKKVRNGKRLAGKIPLHIANSPFAPWRRHVSRAALHSTSTKHSMMVRGSSTAATTMDPYDEVYKGSESTAASSTTPVGISNDIKTMRRALEEAQNRDVTAKAALAKSDKVILELRSDIKSLKKQIEKLTAEKEQGDAMQAKYRHELERLQQSAEYSLQNQQESHNKSLQDLKSQLAKRENGQSRDSLVGELQVQLDRAHAQLLTSDMVRKELEDTLEAEQYTWDLRVQDQERTIATLQQECRTLREDLEHCRSQWKEAEEGWTRELQELQSNNASRSTPAGTGTSQDAQILQERLTLLEEEREELQACLDEAMQELEAVDQELRASPGSAVEPLVHLYQWLLDRSDSSAKEIPTTTNELVDVIQAHIESIPSANLVSNTDAALKVAELEAEISVFRGDIKARDESNAELRTSLKEAVALLKPLQDAVAKSEQEKKDLQEQLKAISNQVDMTKEIDKRDRQIEDLQGEVRELMDELILVKQSSKESPERTSRSLQASGEEGAEDRNMFSSPSSLSKAREDLKAKRESEAALQQMLKNAQGRFHALHKENHSVEAQNQALRDRIQELEAELERLEVKNEETVRRNVAAEMIEGTVQQLEQEIKGYQEELQLKEEEVIRLEEELSLLKEKILAHEKTESKMKAQLEELKETSDRIEDMEGELSAAKGDLEAHKEAETVLAKSLKQAVGLLRPLETHLETAEQEKRELRRELKTLKKRLAKLESVDSESRSLALSLPNEVEMHDRELPGTARKLEQENHALEEVPQNSRALSGGGQNDRNHLRLKENLVELNSRYEVTQNKLERAVVENNALIDALKHKESDERKIEAELRDLREELMRSNHALENAKYIATSALVKVEELTMENVARMSLSREGEPLDMSKDYSHLIAPLDKQERLRSIGKVVEHASRANKMLEGSLEDREKIVRSLTSTPVSSGEMAVQSSMEGWEKHQSRTQREPPLPPSAQRLGLQVPVQQQSSPRSAGARHPQKTRRPSELPPWASSDDYD